MTTHHQNFFSKKIPSWYRISKSVWRLLLHIERKYALFFTTLHLFRNFKEQKKCQNRVFRLNVHTCMWPDLKNCPPSLRAWHSYNPSSWRWTPLMINSETFHLKIKFVINCVRAYTHIFYGYFRAGRVLLTSHDTVR